MYYSLIGFLALLILAITNHDVLFKKAKVSAPKVQKIYRKFLIAVIVYYITDMCWGILESLSLTYLLFLDTEIYFFAMALGILFWTQYVVAYLDDRNSFRSFLSWAGIIFFISVCILTTVNFFMPVMFWFDEAGRYHTAFARYAILIIQIILLLLTSIYAFRVSAIGKERSRHLTIGLSGFTMLIFIAIQVFFPYLPLYAIGYMMGCCLLRTFVIENEKEEYRKELELALERETQEVQELNTAWKLAYTDALTGVKSKLAYVEKQDRLDEDIANGRITELGVAVFDVNDLKLTNDTKGHDVGDAYIISSCRLICEIFKHSPVYRVGGDEFVAILEGEDYRDRAELMAAFDRQIEENRKKGEVVISGGMAEYLIDQDNSFKRVFERADYRMYERKKGLKKPGGRGESTERTE